MKRIIFAAVVILMFMNFNAWAEDRPQLTLAFTGGRELVKDANLNYKLYFINLSSSYAPYAYLGGSYQLSKHFGVELVGGYGFEPQPETRGFLSGVVFSVNFGNLMISSDLEYLAGLRCFWSYQYIGYRIGSVVVGVDNRNNHYIRAEDEKKRTYQVGPSVMVPMGAFSYVKLVYYYSFENDGEDAHVTRAIVGFKF